MADESPLKQLYPYIAWAPFFERGKFQYWAPVGRGRTKIGKDGHPRTELYGHAHISGGSIWLRLLPPGEEPDAPPDQEPEDQPQRSDHVEHE
jgi:hypothetical protein